MPIRLILPALTLMAAAAATGQTKPSEAAKAFTLDAIAPAPTPSATPDAAPSAAPRDAAPPAATPLLATPVIPESATVATPAAPAPSAAPAIRAVFTLDTPIQDLIANPGAKAVLDKDLPGMSNDENLDKFKMLSLRSLQPQTGGQLTDAMLAKVASDLDVLGGGTGAVAAPLKAGNSKRNRDGSR